MSATYVSNLVINTYTDFSQIFDLSDSQSNSALDLTGYSVSSQMRKYQNSTNYVSFAATVYNASNGQIQIGLTTSQTANIKPGRYIYDVVVIDNIGKTSRVVEGMVLVREGATH
jgi:hypothetical protein